MSIFDEIEEAPMVYLPPGFHDFRVARLIPQRARTSERVIIMKMELLRSWPRQQNGLPKKGSRKLLTLTDSRRTWCPCLGGSSLLDLGHFFYSVLGLHHHDPRREQLLQPISGSELWPTNRTREPLPLLSNLIEHAVSVDNLLGGLCVRIESAMTWRDQLFRYMPPDYEALGISPPDLEAILLKARLPVESTVDTYLH